MIKRLLGLGLAATLAVGLASAGVSYALWTSQASASGSAQAGSIGITLTGGSSLNATYATTMLSASGSILVTNSGSVAVTYSSSATLGANSSSSLAGATRVEVWPESTAACTAATPGSAAVGSWTSVPSLSGSLAPGASARWCVRTILTSQQLIAQSGGMVYPEITATAVTGTWTASSKTSSIQRVAVTTSTGPQATCENQGYFVWLRWNGSSYPQTVKYGVFLNGTQLPANDSLDWWNPYAGIDVSEVHAVVTAEGNYTIEIRRMDVAPTTLVATGKITLTNNGFEGLNNHKVVCG